MDNIIFFKQLAKWR